MGKIFNKGLDKDDKEEGLFKRLKKFEYAQKGLINGDNKNKSKDEDEDEKKQQNNNIDTKLSNVFNYLKSLSQEARDLMK